jgi:hypothetical protein
MMFGVFIFLFQLEDYSLVLGRTVTLPKAKAPRLPEATRRRLTVHSPVLELVANILEKK